MATSCLTSSSSPFVCITRTSITEPFVSSSLPSSIHFHYPRLSCFLALSSVPISHSSEPFTSSSSSSFLWSSTGTATIYNKKKKKKKKTGILALLENEQFAATTPAESPVNSKDNIEDGSASWNSLRPCELYVCNLPRDCGISQLLDMFQHFGTVQSVEVSRNAETGISRGCGYVTMTSINEAKAAMAALDGSDVGGRELRVMFSVDMNTGRKNIEALNSAPNKNLIFESPYKVYAGNLAWSVKPEDLRNLFSQFGTVVSSRVLHDRKAGKNRVYGFLSFSSAAELVAAMSLNGTDFCGRTLLLREVLKQNEP